MQCISTWKESPNHKKLRSDLSRFYQYLNLWQYASGSSLYTFNTLVLTIVQSVQSIADHAENAFFWMFYLNVCTPHCPSPSRLPHAQKSKSCSHWIWAPNTNCWQSHLDWTIAQPHFYLFYLQLQSIAIFPFHFQSSHLCLLPRSLHSQGFVHFSLRSHLFQLFLILLYQQLHFFLLMKS